MDNSTGNIIGPDSFGSQQLPLRQLEIPQGDVVHLWHLDFARLNTPLNQQAGQQSHELLVFQQKATRRFYLRLLLGAYLGIPGKDIRISRRVKGRLELDDAQSHRKLDFSVARSNEGYLIGVSSGAAIGVDLEIAERQAGKPLALAKRYFSETETRALSALDGMELQRAFMHTWACKEAIVKASGLGIANQLCRFSVDVNPDNPPSVLEMQDDDPKAWTLAVAKPVKGSLAVVAVRQDSIKMKGFRLR